jgi:phosphate transport system substrate-binding protein
VTDGERRGIGAHGVSTEREYSMPRVTWHFGTAVSVLALAIGALLVGPQTAQAQHLTGAGSTFINPIMTQWIADYQKATGVSINYQPIGSGGGINGLIHHTVDFAGSDAPMNAQEMAEAKAPVLHLPAVIGAVVVGYNLPGVSTGLHLTGPVIADIFLGKITYWDDPQIAKLNGGIRVPHARIFVAHRSDGSGTTYIFSDYLAKVSPDWKTRVGVGKSLQWPIGLGGKGNAGVAGLLRTRPNSIGYCELAYAQQNNISYAAVRNAKGKFIMPSSESASEAVEGAKLPADMRASITNTSNPSGYSITGFTWLIVYRDANRDAALKRFLEWVVTKGQGYTKPLAYAALPPSVQQKTTHMIAAIR